MGYGPPPQGYPQQGGYQHGYGPPGYGPPGYGYQPPRAPPPTDPRVWWGVGLLVMWAVGFGVGVGVPAFGLLLGGVVAVAGGVFAYGAFAAGAPPALKGLVARVRPFGVKAALVVACVVTSAPFGAWLGIRKAQVAAAQEQAAKEAHETACTQARADASAAVSSLAKRTAAAVLEGCGETAWAATLVSDANRQAKEEEAKARAEEAKAKEAKAKADWPGALKELNAAVVAADRSVASGKLIDADDLLASKQQGLAEFDGTSVTSDVDFVDAQARVEAKRKAIAARVAPLRKARAEAEERERKKQADAAEETKYVHVSAIQLFQDYDANEVAADAKYKGRLLKVTGTVDGVDKFMGEPVVKLTSSNMFMPVNAFGIPESDAGRLEKGTQIVLVCTGAGKGMTPTLRACEWQ